MRLNSIYSVADTSLYNNKITSKMEVNPPPGIRKNINSLTEQERKRYFWCIKMLGILPPFDYSTTRSFLSLGTRGTKYIPYNLVNPKCLHDLLISSYTTACADPQVQTNLFGLYHRHLMIYYQIMLNYCDDVLQKPFRYVMDNYPSLITPDNAVLWKSVLAEYMQVAIPEKVMAHYWNPTNYEDQTDILPPPELVYPEFYPEPRQPDSMDNLFKSIRGHFPWQISPKKRWYNDQGIYATEKPKLVKELLAKGYLYASDFEYSSDQAQVVSGQIDARANFSLYYENYTSLSDLSSPGIIPHSFKKNMYKSYQSLMDNSPDGDVVTTFPHSYDQIFINLGARRTSSGLNIQSQYFSSQEIDEETDISMQQNKLLYNNSLAHFQLGYAIYNHDFKDFVRFLGPKNGQPFDLSSDFVNNLHYAMIDGPYNASNLLFFPYHSWVDAQMEINIRRNRIEPTDPTQPRPADKMGAFLQTYSAAGYKLKEYYNTDPTKSAAIGIDIVDYGLKRVPVSQSSNDYRYEIRTSFQMQQIYSWYRTQQQLLQKYPNFKSFNFNYDYQMREIVFFNDEGVVVNKYFIGDRQQVRYPRYVKRMSSQVAGYKQYIGNIIKKDMTNKLGFINDLVQRGYIFDVLYIPPPDGGKSHCSGTIKFGVDMAGVIEKLKEIGIQLSPDQIIKAQKLKIYKEIEVFQTSQTNNSKQKQKQTNQSQGSTLFWCETAQTSNKQLIYHNREQQSDYMSHDCIKISTREQLAGRNGLVELQGAQKIKFYLIMDSDRKPIQDFAIEIKAKVRWSSSLTTTKLIKKQMNIKSMSKIGASQSKGQTVYTFTLQSQNANDKQKWNSNKQQKLIYTSLAANIKIENDSAELFRFNIRKYHKLAHYYLTLSQKQGDLTAKVQQVPTTTMINQYLASLTA